MKKILNYITAGQGLGIRFLLIFSAVIALVYAVYVRTMGADLIPYAQDIADQMLPIKVENGIVVEPANTIKKAQLRVNENMSPIELPFIINTTVDNLDTSTLTEGAYITRTALYIVNKNEVKIYQYENDFELPLADYRDTFKSALFWSAVFVFIFGGIFLFISFFILSIFYAVCAHILSAIISRRYNFDLRMRLSILCIISTYILFYLFELLGLETSRLTFFAVVIATQLVIMLKLSQENTPQTTTSEQTDDKTLTSAWPEEIVETPKTTTVKKKTPTKKKAATKKATVAAPKTTASVKKTAATKKTTATKKTWLKKRLKNLPQNN